MELSAGMLVAAAVIMAIGCTLQAAVGFGFALFSAPLLLLIDTGFVPGPILLAALPLCVWSWWREREAVDVGQLPALLAGAALGTLAGVATLKLLATAAPTRLFGVLILMAVGVSLISRQIAPSPRNLLMGGGIGGWMGALAGVHGPPVALVLQHAAPATVRSVLGAYFAVAYAMTVAALWLIGLFDAASLARAVAILPGTLIGMVAGPRLTPYLDHDRSRIAILALSALSALLLIVR